MLHNTHRPPTRSVSKAFSRGALVAVLGVASSMAWGCGASPAPRATTAPGIVATPGSIEGSWYVVASNLPMWTDGKKTDPVISYSALTPANDSKLHDVLRFVADGKPDTYVGTDTRDPKDQSHFTWRGAGMLSFVSADWYISKMADDKSWAVISYGKTVGTPAGVDIISRTPHLDPASLQAAKSFVANDPVLNKTGGPLAEVPQGSAKQNGVGALDKPAARLADQ